MLGKRGLYAVMSVRPSVHPSVTFVNSDKTNKHIFIFFTPSDNHIIPVLRTKSYDNISTGTPP